MFRYYIISIQSKYISDFAKILQLSRKIMSNTIYSIYNRFIRLSTYNVLSTFPGSTNIFFLKRYVHTTYMQSLSF